MPLVVHLVKFSVHTVYNSKLILSRLTCSEGRSLHFYDEVDGFICLCFCLVDRQCVTCS